MQMACEAGGINNMPSMIAATAVTSTAGFA
jgi:hypothetical protein